MEIQLVVLLKIAGWILTIGPLAAFLLFAIIMVREIANNDDESLKGLVSIGFILFGIGVVFLVVSYLGSYFMGSSSGNI
jgi:hypothetical protein